MIIIGLLSWTGIAQFVRAELLRIRRQEYIEAAQALGFSDRRILFRHALPNALTPVLITVAFGIAGAVLLESFLSFLGIGLAAESVTWGTMLNLARYQFNAWWLAVFPGLAIFFTVTLFNLIGERLTEAMDPRGR
jgi:peptide/nickel transport system permease protein